MKNTIYLYLLFSIIFCNCLIAQNEKQGSTNKVNILGKDDSTYFFLNNYLINNNYIEKENNTIYLYNLLSWKEYDIADSCGIYFFGIEYQEPLFLLFFQHRDKSYSILKKITLPIILNELTVFFKKNDLQDKRIQLFYALSLLKFFDTSNNYLLEERYLPRDWHK